jgi:transposase
MPAFVAVGIDCSDDHHDVHAVGPDPGASLRFRVPNTLAGFEELLTRLTARWPELPLHFGVENPALLLARFLQHRECRLYALNPRSVARMREALAAGGQKDDRLDAQAICLLLRERSAALAPLRPSTAATEELAGLVEQRVDVVEEKNRLLNQLTAVLKGFYPRALELFANLEQPLTLAFLTAFPTPMALTEATREAWNQLFAGQRYPRPAQVERLWERSRQPQVPVSAVDVTLGGRQVQRLVRLLRVLLEDLRALEAEIEQRFTDHPEAEVFQSLPGAGPTLAPALLALFGDNRERWGAWTEIARASGVSPITRQSGRLRTVHLRRHCDRRARRTLHLFASCSRRNCAWAREYHAAQRAAGKSHGTALRNLAAKWLRILFRLWQDGTPYDEAVYLRRREERQAPLAVATSLTSS